MDPYTIIKAAGDACMDYMRGAEILSKLAPDPFMKDETTTVIVTAADRAVCLGSGELKPCPCCGSSAIAAGEFNRNTGNTVYKIICTGLHECGLNLVVCDKDREKARKHAVERWNERAVTAK